MAHHEGLSFLRPGFKSRYEHHSIELTGAKYSELLPPDSDPHLFDGQGQSVGADFILQMGIHE